MGYGVVCISSHDGAGAGEVARGVANSLHFPLIDEDIVTQAAVDAGVDTSVVADVERRKSTLAKMIDNLAAAGSAGTYLAAPPQIDARYGQPGSEALRALIRSAIEDKAAAGNVVIGAHAASFALARSEGVLRVLVTAPVEARQRRLAAELGIDEKEAARAIKRSDAGRADYLKRFYGVGTERPTHYDLVINTEKITPADAIVLIVHAASASPVSA